MNNAAVVISLIALMLLPGCSNLGGASLVFGQQQNVGITLAGSGPSQEAELTLGYKDKNIAVVPVAVKQGDGTYKEIGGGIGEGENGGSSSDAYSTLGQFELTTSNQASGPSVGLGKFFATGTAAQTLSQGFADKLKGSKPTDAETTAPTAGSL